MILVTRYPLCFTYILLTITLNTLDISYEYISPNKYYVCVSFYRDCYGINVSSTLYGVEFNSASCNQSFTQTFPKVAGPIEVSQLCPPQLPQSTCGSGSLTGVELHIYCDTITFPAQCSDWVISYDICCRNVSNNLISPTTEDLYVEATINNLNN